MTPTLTWNPPSVLIHKMGGIAGDMSKMAITDCKVENVTMRAAPAVALGGIVGKVVDGTLSNNRVINLDVTRNTSTSGIYGFGGLVGLQEAGTIEDSLVQGSQIIDNTANKPYLSSGIGGAVGIQQGTLRRVGVISTQVTGGSNLGGLVGAMLTNAYIEDSFADASVSASALVSGGAIGYLNTTASGTRVLRVHSNSEVSPKANGDDMNGFVGSANASNKIVDSYWNNDAGRGGGNGGDSSSAGLSGLTISQMQDTAYFPNWDFSSTGPWMMDSYPLLNSLGPW